MSLHQAFLIHLQLRGGILNHALLLNDSDNEWKSFYNTAMATDPPLLGLTLSEGR